MKIPFLKIICVTLLLGTVLAYGQSTPIEGTGVGNSASVKGAAEQAMGLAGMGVQAVCPERTTATLIKVVSVRTEQIITTITEGGQPRNVTTFRVTFTGQYECR